MYCRPRKTARRDTEHFLAGTLAAEDCAAHLSYRGNSLVAVCTGFMAGKTWNIFRNVPLLIRQSHFDRSWNNVVPLGPLMPMRYPDAYEHPELAT